PENPVSKLTSSQLSGLGDEHPVGVGLCLLVSTLISLDLEDTTVYLALLVWFHGLIFVWILAKLKQA
ncbi:MAG TPA: hypothetical protein V6D03_10890, partial [Candidatus Caenarcaniphilales bacterium]